MPRSKKTGRTLTKRKTSKDRLKPSFKMASSCPDVWILKNFLVPLEKRALIEFYRDRISQILNKNRGDEMLSREEEHDMRRFGERIKFIMDHF